MCTSGEYYDYKYIPITQDIHMQLYYSTDVYSNTQKLCILSYVNIVVDINVGIHNYFYYMYNIFIMTIKIH